MSISIDDTITLTIHDLAYGGDGVGRHDGMAVFVPHTLPDEEATVQITHRSKNFARAKLLEITKPAPTRIAPACPLAHQCPGCSYLHIEADAELQYKKQQLESLFTRIARIETPPIQACIPSPQNLGYRNKIVLHADDQGNLGYKGHDNRTIIDVPSCPLAVPAINTALKTFRKERPSLQKGDSVTFRWSATDGVRIGTKQAPLGGRLTETAPCGPMQVPTKGFWQVNHYAMPLLYQAVRDIVAPLKPTNLIDLYCGSGLLTFATQPYAQHILGIENNQASVRAARRNAHTFGYSNIEFTTSDAAELYPQAISQVPAAETMVILDPPRQGIAPALRNSIAQTKPAYVLYVSCAADKLARDLKELIAAGYVAEQAQLINMFPRTALFETLVLLKTQS